MPAVPAQRREVLDLRVQAERRGPTTSRASRPGNSAIRALHDLGRRVLRVDDAEEELVAGVIEPEEAAEVLFEPLVDALQRLVDRDRRGVVGQPRARCGSPRAGRRARASVEATAKAATRVQQEGGGRSSARPPGGSGPDRPGRGAGIIGLRRDGGEVGDGRIGSQSGFIRRSIGPWQHGQVCGDRTPIVQTSQ